MKITHYARSIVALAALLPGLACSRDVLSPEPLRRLPGTADPSGALVTTTTVVRPSSLGGWTFLDDNGFGGAGSFVAGPATAPTGTGSAQIAVALASQGYALGAAILQGTPLTTLTTLRYSGLRQTADAGNNLAMALQVNVDYDLNDAAAGWQGRLVFEPYHLGGGGSVVEDTWQTWDAMGGSTGGWFSTGNPVLGNAVVAKTCTMALPCTWAQVLALYPNAGVHATLGAVLFKAGSGWAGFTGNVDQFVIGTAALETTYDFEPETPCTMTCYADVATGNDAFGGDSPTSAKKTIQAAVNQVTAGGTVIAAAGSYPEQVNIPKALTLDGAGTGATVLQGAGGLGNGINLAGGLSGVTVTDLTVQGYDIGIRMFTGPLTSISFTDVEAINNKTHGIWSQAFGVTNIAFTRVNASGNNAAGGLSGRGLWMINGVKTGITIVDGQFNNNGLVGIDLSDGSVTGATITGNTVTGNGDSGIGVLGAMGPGANVVDNNIVTNNGRYGIEIKMPSGSGASSGAGSVVVRNNTVSRTVAATDARDYAGIAVFRRFPVSPINADQPTGVVVQGNTVSGYTRKPAGSTGDGFGIVVEGTGHVVTQNIVSGNDVGIQIQSGNVINTQGTPYFDRGDANPSSALVNRNSITGSTVHDLRNVGAPLTDATCNWFGTATGPTAGKVSGSLTTSPWLATADLDGACPVLPPAVTTAAADAFGNEGATLTTSGEFSGVGLTLTADNGGAGTFTDNGDGTWSWSYSTTDDVAIGTITVTATDVFSQTTGDAFDYRALNVAPSLTVTAPIGGTLYALGAATSISSSFTDPGSADTHTCTFNWDDATTTGPVASGAGTCNASHTFLAAGVYQITVTVTDDDLGTDTESVMVIVYDPNAGFVTGGGWIVSPAGAFAADLSLTGRANFGFVSKYVKGKTLPTGNTEFHFQAGGLTFSSTSYEWLVVSGAKAQYKGAGTLNGIGGYRFMLTAIDGQVSGGGGLDRFRIRIWAPGDALIYDNMLNAPDSADPTTVLGGGNIIIHAPKK